MNKYIIITSINDKTFAIKEFCEFKDWTVVYVADKKSPQLDSEDNFVYLSVEKQNQLFPFANQLPYNHYCRKNIGYLYAISRCAEIIYETDDDNIPYPNWSNIPFTNSKLSSSKLIAHNIYKDFSSSHVWPRGLPLSLINEKHVLKTINKTVNVGVWQGLADKDPDVDAIYRLTNGKEIIFKKRSPIVLDKGTFCPFNSQNTFWKSDFFILAYLPVTANFRETDILRGFIAQRLLWEKNYYLGFTKATVYQERNDHDFMKDFKSEVDVFLKTDELLRLLDSLKLSGNLGKDLLYVYELLAKVKLVRKEELEYVQSWVKSF